MRSRNKKSSQIRAPCVVPHRSTSLAQPLTFFGVTRERNECNVYTPGFDLLILVSLVPLVERTGTTVFRRKEKAGLTRNLHTQSN